MKVFILAILLIAGAVSCNEAPHITGRPDPYTSTSGTLGSAKVTNGVQPLTGNGIPGPRDTLLAKH